MSQAEIEYKIKTDIFRKMNDSVWCSIEKQVERETSDDVADGISENLAIRSNTLEQIQQQLGNIEIEALYGMEI